MTDTMHHERQIYHNLTRCVMRRAPRLAKPTRTEFVMSIPAMVGPAETT
jgi:hypothetical protein